MSICSWIKSFSTKKAAKIVVEPLPKVNVPEGLSLDQQTRRELILLVREDLNERETQGKNSSPMIDKVNKTVKGAYFRAPYCLSGLVARGLMRLCAKHNWKLPPWMNIASTQEFWEKAPEKYKIPKGRPGEMADICIMRQYSDADRGHAYILEDDQISTTQHTIEYNTDGSGGRDGDGVYRRIRTQDGDSSKKYLGAVDVIQAILDYNQVKG